MLFQGLPGVLRVLIVGLGAYVALIVVLRVTGKRTLSKMNAFDLVVTVALGSTLATVLLSKDVALAEGVAAFTLLVLLQYLVTFAAVRSPRFRGWIKAEPQRLLNAGEFDEAAMRRERVTRDEIMAALRQSGHDDPAAIRSVTLETDGSLSVVPMHDGRGG